VLPSYENGLLEFEFVLIDRAARVKDIQVHQVSFNWTATRNN